MCGSFSAYWMDEEDDDETEEANALDELDEVREANLALDAQALQHVLGRV